MCEKVFCKDCMHHSSFDSFHFCIHKSCFEQYKDGYIIKTRRILDDTTKNRNNDCSDFCKEAVTWIEKIKNFFK